MRTTTHLCLMLSLVVLSCTAASAGWDVTQLTDNTWEDRFCNVSEGHVAWWSDAKGDRSLMLHDGTVSSRIAGAASKVTDLTLDGERVVWSDLVGSSWDVHFYDGSDVTWNAGNKKYDDQNPIFWGSDIVWERAGLPNIKHALMLWDGTSVSEFAADGGDHTSARACGDHITWQQSNGKGYDVLLSDGANTTTLTAPKKAYNECPDVSGDWVVWRARGSVNDDWDIYAYDGNAITAVTSNTCDDGKPRVWGNTVVWSGWDGNDYEIFTWDGATTSQVTDNSWDDYDPVISGANIAWSAYPDPKNQDEELFAWDGSAVTRLTDNDYEDSWHRISGDTIVWMGHDGEDYEILTATPSSVSDDSPEPATWVLLACTAVAGGVLRRRRAH